MKKVCFVSGTRADYGLIYWLMKAVQADADFELQVAVTGMHLDDKFGNTWTKFSEDGFPVSAKVSLGDMEDSRLSVVRQVAEGVRGFGEAFARLEPDLVVVVGDRYEMLAATEAAMLMNMPIAHLHGGEVTEGAFDDGIRHAITKLSSYHFSSTEEYRARVIRMGEFPDSVVNIGAIGLENLRKVKLLNKQEIENKIGFSLREKNFLITYHPLTNANEDDIDSLLEALSFYSNYGQVITMPNSDPGFSHIVKKLKDYGQGRDNVFLTVSLGSLLYPSLLAACDVVIGNSSSGIVEAPFYGTPTVNIGSRQKGRVTDSTVVTCDGAGIKGAIEKALHIPRKQSLLYGDGDSSTKFMDFIKGKDFRVKRGFYDV